MTWSVRSCGNGVMCASELAGCVVVCKRKYVCVCRYVQLCMHVGSDPIKLTD